LGRLEIIDVNRMGIEIKEKNPAREEISSQKNFLVIFFQRLSAAIFSRSDSDDKLPETQ